MFYTALRQKLLVTFDSFCLYLRNQANLCILKSQNIRKTNFSWEMKHVFLEVKNKKNIRKMEGGKFCWIFFCVLYSFKLHPILKVEPFVIIMHRKRFTLEYYWQTRIHNHVHKCIGFEYLISIDWKSCKKLYHCSIFIVLIVDIM